MIDDAGLTVSDDAIDDVLALGAGSARDTLSALELVASAEAAWNCTQGDLRDVDDASGDGSLGHEVAGEIRT